MTGRWWHSAVAGWRAAAVLERLVVLVLLVASHRVEARWLDESIGGALQIPFQGNGGQSDKMMTTTTSATAPKSLRLTHVVHAGGARHPGLLVAKSFGQDDIAAQGGKYRYSVDPRRDGAPENWQRTRGADLSRADEEEENSFLGEDETWPAVHHVKVHPQRMRVFKARDMDSVENYRVESLNALHRPNVVAPALLHFNWEEDEVQVPDLSQRQVISAFARMASNAYTTPDASDWYDLPPVVERQRAQGWTGVSSFRKEHHFNDSLDFGWETDGVRGHVFADERNETIVIAIKGTSAGWWTGGGGKSGRNDKFNDNLLFSCCCARVDYSFPTVCDCFSRNNTCGLSCLQHALSAKSVYYNALTDLYSNVTAMYPDANIWLTGHSLGGALSSLLALTYGVPTIAFESPGERLAAERLHLPRPPSYDYTDMPIWHYGVSSDPIFTGSCTGWNSLCWAGGFALETACHMGKTCVYDTIKELNWTTSIQTHSINVVIDKVIDVWPKDETPVCEVIEACGDCNRWDFTDSPAANR